MMANDVYHRLTVKGHGKEVLEYVRSEHGAIDFERVIPMPKELDFSPSVDAEIVAAALNGDLRQNSHVTRLRQLGLTTREEVLDYFRSDEEVMREGRELADNIKTHGFGSWYEWRTENWGTKWNAYKTMKPETDDSNIVVMRFCTAWNPPSPVIERLSKIFPSSRFEMKYFDEGWCFAGTERYKNGLQSVNDIVPTKGNPQTRHLHRAVFQHHMERDVEIER